MRHLVILEVSQKQAFIFSSNKLKDNIENSAIIAWVTNSSKGLKDVEAPGFFEEVIPDRTLYDPEENIVYSGGGHTVLVFDTKEKARNFVKKITLAVKKCYPTIELFAKVFNWDEKKISSAGEALKKLSSELEIKKAKRTAAFRQGSFGIEPLGNTNRNNEDRRPVAEKEIEESLTPDGFKTVSRFDQLGGSKEKSNFIAVVHIDGNSMGKRVAELRNSMKNEAWNEYRKKQKSFSDSIDKDFKNAYLEMVQEVVKRIEDKTLDCLNLEEKHLPVRRIITAGDDICFVSEGRIGIECARIFIEKLAEKKNAQDGKKYAACAGVAIVHQKYPFYQAYELAEELCSNAKRFIVNTAEGNDVSADVSAIDWHIEYGEMKDHLEDIRESYRTRDGARLELRPYIINGNIQGEENRCYKKFKKLITQLNERKIDYARGKIKGLCRYLKDGKNASDQYMKRNLIDELNLIGFQDIFAESDLSKVGTGKGQERKSFIQTKDGEMRSLFFDAIQLMDTFIALDGEE